MKAKLIKMFVLTSWLAVGLLIPATGVHAQPKDEPKGTPVLKPGLMKKGTVKSVDGAGVVTVVIGGKEQKINVGPEAAKTITKDQSQAVKVCSGGYWWTVTWAYITQGGPCSVQ